MDQTADLITALDFIEHIVDPENFARECFRVLKSGGEAFINTPNIRFWKHIEQLKYGGRFPHTSGDREVFHGGHLAFFTLSDLCDIFGDAGFTSFEQFKDDECFEAPPMPFLTGFNPKSQQEYVNLLMELGCPNLLFKAVKP
jgi:predicted SAM-dependent methyltransferase